MSKEVTVEELRERLDDYVADVGRGETLRLLLSDGRAATITLEESGLVFAHVPPAGIRLGDYRPSGLGRPLDFDSLEFLTADREKDRNW
ncbi:MAG TPA: hypothetical protein VEK57_17295 [Thermoanaerobaculia bacterium]|nr:hypothetical protein [Thermoanaerobaculia bacterium]